MNSGHLTSYPNINIEVKMWLLSASLFVLLNECTLASYSVHILMLCLSLAGLTLCLRALETCRGLASLQWARLAMFSCQMAGLAQ